MGRHGGRARSSSACIFTHMDNMALWRRAWVQSDGEKEVVVRCLQSVPWVLSEKVCGVLERPILTVRGRRNPRIPGLLPEHEDVD